MNSNRGLIIVVLVATMMVLCSPAAALVTSHQCDMTTVSEMNSYEEYAETQARIAEDGLHTFHSHPVGAEIVGKMAGNEYMFPDGTFYTLVFDLGNFDGVEMKAPKELVEEIIVTEARDCVSWYKLGGVSRSGHGMAMKDASGVGDALFEILHLDEIDNGREISQMGMSLNAVEYLTPFIRTVASCETEYRDATAVQAMEVLGREFMPYPLGGGFMADPGIVVEWDELKAQTEKVLVKEVAVSKARNCVSMIDFSEASGYHVVLKDASGIDYAFAEDVFGFRWGVPVAVAGSVDATLNFLEDMIPTSTIGFFDGTF